MGLLHAEESANMMHCRGIASTLGFSRQTLSLLTCRCQQEIRSILSERFWRLIVIAAWFGNEEPGAHGSRVMK